MRDGQAACVRFTATGVDEFSRIADLILFDARLVGTLPTKPPVPPSASTSRPSRATRNERPVYVHPDSDDGCGSALPSSDEDNVGAAALGLAPSAGDITAPVGVPQARTVSPFDSEDVAKVYERLVRPEFTKPWLPVRPLTLWDSESISSMMASTSLPASAPPCPEIVKELTGGYLLIFSAHMDSCAFAGAEESDIVGAYFGVPFLVLGESDISSNKSIQLAVVPVSPQQGDSNPSTVRR